MHPICEIRRLLERISPFSAWSVSLSLFLYVYLPHPLLSLSSFHHFCFLFITIFLFSFCVIISKENVSFLFHTFIFTFYFNCLFIPERYFSTFPITPLNLSFILSNFFISLLFFYFNNYQYYLIVNAYIGSSYLF